MVLIERVCYTIGGVIADFILLAFAPTSVLTASKVLKASNCWGKFSRFATKVSLVDKSPEAITENIFECLPYLNY